MPRKARDVKACLRVKFGFTVPDNKGARHEWLALDLPGIARVAAMFSHNDPDLGDSLLSLIARQLRVTKKDLEAMIDCSISRDAYYARLGPAAAHRL